MKFARGIGARSVKINPAAHARHLAAELLASNRLYLIVIETGIIGINALSITILV